MKGIYYKEGIYVVNDNDEEHEDCVYHYKYKRNVLFGGRVEIRGYYNDNNRAYFSVDGIYIVEIATWRIRQDLSLSQIASYLNAIEANGVDAFIQNYKKNVEFAYQEIKEISQKTELQLASEQREGYINKLLLELKKITDLLISVLVILFSLNSYMAAGIENEKVISVCKSIMNSFS